MLKETTEALGGTRTHDWQVSTDHEWDALYLLRHAGIHTLQLYHVHECKLIRTIYIITYLYFLMYLLKERQIFFQIKHVYFTRSSTCIIYLNINSQLTRSVELDIQRAVVTNYNGNIQVNIEAQWCVFFLCILILSLFKHNVSFIL